MILGLFLLFMFLFMYYVITASTETTSLEEVKGIFEQTINSDSFSQYITACVEKSLQDGLILLGQQGGFIYRDQGSITPRAPIQRTQDEIAYLINPTHLQKPWYPCFTHDNPPGFCNFTNNISLFPKLHSYSFGRSSLPFLTKSQGPLSIQEQLESYITVKTKECINLPSLVETPELAGYNLSAGEITTEVKFGINDVSAVISYPTSIKVNDKKITKIRSYGAKIEVRFKKIYISVLESIQKDNNFLDFNLIQDTKLGRFKGEFLKFKELHWATITKKPINNYDSLIIINDSLSKIKAQPFIFQFAVKNRRPVLDYIPEIIVDHSTQLTISPKAADPDEDLINFSYTGWRSSSSFIPTQQDIGSHIITVHASDSQLEDYQNMKVTICDPSSNIGSLPNICIEKCGSSLECSQHAIDEILESCTQNLYLKDICSQQCQTITSNTCGCGSPCKDKQAYLAAVEGWCYGSSGCESLCTSEIVRRGAQDTVKLWECGCNPSNSGSDCDSDFNGIFEGSCQNSICIPN